MKLSLLIVSYNAGQLLRECVESLEPAAQGSGQLVEGEPLEVEVIVVDNASVDPEVAAVRRDFPWVRWVQSPENRGFSAAVNEGAACSKGELLLLLNPDTRVGPEGLAEMTRAFLARQNAAGMGFRQVDAEGELQLSVGLKPGFGTELVRRVVQRGFDRGGSVARAVVDRWLGKARKVSWVAGSVLMVRRRDFDAVAGFDEGFFLYFEDIDFCLRLGEAVGPVWFEPSVTLVHHRGQSARTASAASDRAYRESQLYFWGKHRGRLHRGVMAAWLRVRGKHPE